MCWCNVRKIDGQNKLRLESGGGDGNMGGDKGGSCKICCKNMTKDAGICGGGGMQLSEDLTEIL